MKARERIIVALDTPTFELARVLAEKLSDEVGLVKVGLELYVAEGPASVRVLREQGHRVFLDLKLHDIPNTVGSAARSASLLDVQMLTVHASGGRAMVEAAVRGAREGAEAAGVDPPTVLAVTILTSLNDAALHAVGMLGPSAAAVERLARLAVSAGAGGIVCSPAEAEVVRAAVGEGVTIVTPGVRPEGSGADDQARVATPAFAVRAGADYLVVGRPIRDAEDPVAAARGIVAEIEAG